MLSVLLQIKLGKKTMLKFNAAKKKAMNEMKSQVFLNPYKSVNLPPRTGAIAEPKAKAMF